MQACRKGENPGLDSDSDDDSEQDDSVDDDADEDVAFFHATVPGTAAKRRASGSLFIQAIVEIFKKHIPDEPLYNLMLRVKGKVTADTKSQVPVHTETLYKQLFFEKVGRAGPDQKQDEQNWYSRWCWLF